MCLHCLNDIFSEVCDLNRRERREEGESGGENQRSIAWMYSGRQREEEWARVHVSITAESQVSPYSSLTDSLSVDDSSLHRCR